MLSASHHTKGMSVDYIMLPGERPMLPSYLNQGNLQLLQERPDTPLAAAFPGALRRVTLMGMDGRPAAAITFGETDWSVMPQVGHIFPVSPHSISSPEQPSDLPTYRLGPVVELSPQRPIAPALTGFWQRHEILNLPVREIYRVIPAVLIGQVPTDAPDDDWLETDTGRWRLTRGSFVLREFNGYGGRVTDINYMIREFSAITGLGSNTPTATFTLPNFG